MPEGQRGLRSGPPRANIGNSSELNDMTVAELANQMKAQMEANQRTVKEELQKMGERFTKQIESLRTDLMTDIEKLRNECRQTFSELTASIDKTKEETIQAIDAVKRSNDLIISGVPTVHGEDLLSYFQKWCYSLGYAENNTPLVDIRRLPTKSEIKTNTALIKLEFAFTSQRQDFYSRYLRTRSLSTTTIGFSVDKRIYINENLGPSARAIRSHALKLKKDGKLHNVLSRNGVICVKLNKNSAEVAAKTIEDLKPFTNQK